MTAKFRSSAATGALRRKAPRREDGPGSASWCRIPGCATTSSVVSALAGPPNRSPVGCGLNSTAFASAMKRSTASPIQSSALRKPSIATCPSIAGAAGRARTGDISAVASRTARACVTGLRWLQSVSSSGIDGVDTSPLNGIAMCQDVLPGGESLVALAEGLQNAWWTAGGARRTVAPSASRASGRVHWTFRRSSSPFPQSRRGGPDRPGDAMRGSVHPRPHGPDAQQQGRRP